MPPPEDIAIGDERALLADAAAGSPGALTRLFELHSAQVHRVAYRLTMSADDAEDVVQDVFIGLPEALAAYGGHGGFSAWIRRVTVRTALMRMRAGRRRAATAERAAEDRRDASPDGVIDRMAIAAALV